MSRWTGRFVLAVSLLAGLLLSSCQRRTSTAFDSISIGAQLLESYVPILAAEERRLFARHGLRVAVKGYDTGLQSVEAMLAGEVDVAATVSDYVLVRLALEGTQLQTFASYNRTDSISIVARRDKGVLSIPDLKGKRIGVIRRTNLEFFLGRFLQLHGIAPQDVRIVDTRTLQDSLEGILSGRAEAIITLPPYTDEAVARLGNEARVWPAQTSQPVFVLLVARTDWIAGHGPSIERFLRALSEAEDFMLQHPAEAQTIARRRMGFSDAYVRALWERNRFALSLNEALVAAMKDEARWMIAQKLTAATSIPDVMELISAEGLSTVRPTAVNLIR